MCVAARRKRGALPAIDHLTAQLAPGRVAPQLPTRHGPGAARRRPSCSRGCHRRCRHTAHTTQLCADDWRRAHYDSVSATLVSGNLGAHPNGVRARIHGLGYMGSLCSLSPINAKAGASSSVCPCHCPFVRVDTRNIALTHVLMLPALFCVFYLISFHFFCRGVCLFAVVPCAQRSCCSYLNPTM